MRHKAVKLSVSIISFSEACKVLGRFSPVLFLLWVETGPVNCYVECRETEGPVGPTEVVVHGSLVFENKRNVYEEGLSPLFGEWGFPKIEPTHRLSYYF